MRVSTPPITLATDYQGLVSGFSEDASHTTHAGAKYADAWKELWTAVDDFGKERITVIKTPAHLTLEALQEKHPDLPVRFWHGNRASDTAAKQRVTLHRVPGDVVTKCKASALFVDIIGKYIGRSALSDRKHNIVDVEP